MEAANISHLRLSGILLAAGWVVFWAGAFTPPWKWWMDISAKEYLTLISEHKAIWLWIAGCFAVGVLLTMFGLVVLGEVLKSEGTQVMSTLGQTAFVAGSVLWLASIAFRATATLSAAGEVIDTGVVPNWFDPMHNWAGGLFAVYMVLAYLAIAAIGKAMLITGFEPVWIARTHLIFGLVAAAGFIARIPVFDPPLIVHLVPGILGVVILVRYGWG